MRIAGCYNVVRPDNVSNRRLRLQVQFMFRK
jgi:hypothetical protein